MIRIVIFMLFFFVSTVVVCKKSANQKVKPKETATTADDFELKRIEMVESQIRSRGIKNNQVLEAMLKVPRHKFVSSNLYHHAYRDHPLPIGENQTISQPYIVALMTESLALKGNERVLEIGTGSGYQAAVLAEIVDTVYTIEIIPSLAQKAKDKLRQLSYTNILIRHGDGYQGWPLKAPFDAIIVTAAPDHIPQPLIEQLNKGGRMIIPVGDFYQELVIISKSQLGKITRQTVIPVRFVPMTGEAQSLHK